MDHRFTSEPVDLKSIDALALGDLWTAAHATVQSEKHLTVRSPAAVTASAILDLGKDMAPAFRGAACRDYLDFLASEAAAKPANADEFLSRYDWRKASFALEHCVDLSSGDLGAAARRFLNAANWRGMPHLAIALARLDDADFEADVIEKLAIDWKGSPLLVEEFRAVAALDLPELVRTARVAYPDPCEGEPPDGSHHPLSDLPVYAAFARTGLERAAKHVRGIHGGTVPYASDKAFTLDESAVIARLARVALDRDEPWLPPVLDELFRKVSLAPTAAKSVPSQSVAIALGHAIEAFPTPEAVDTLRGVLRDIRHAGVKHKLQRNLRGAERGLAGRPEIALRLPLDQPLSKPQLTTLSRCLEASLALGLVLSYGDWIARLAGHAQAKELAGSLVWRIRDPSGVSMSIMPVTDRGRLTLQDVTGTAVAAGPGSEVTLWHPLDGTEAERAAWRSRFAQLRIKQPFKQVFREHYIVPFHEMQATETAMFAGHIVAVIPFLGLARRERWHLDDACLTRSFGPWTARLDLADSIYPGWTGGTSTRSLSLWTPGCRTAMPVRLGDPPAAVLSEILRTVDLLVSTSGFAVTDADDERHHEARLLRLAASPHNAMTAMRKQALECALRGLDGMAGVQFDARHLWLGSYAIHLATGRVTRDGEPVAIDTPKRSNLAAVPWLPYDEKLLETILYAALEIARRLKGDTSSS